MTNPTPEHLAKLADCLTESGWEAVINMGDQLPELLNSLGLALHHYLKGTTHAE